MVLIVAGCKSSFVWRVACGNTSGASTAIVTPGVPSSDRHIAIGTLTHNQHHIRTNMSSIKPTAFANQTATRPSPGHRAQGKGHSLGAAGIAPREACVHASPRRPTCIQRSAHDGPSSRKPARRPHNAPAPTTKPKRAIQGNGGFRARHAPAPTHRLIPDHQPPRSAAVLRTGPMRRDAKWFHWGAVVEELAI